MRPVPIVVWSKHHRSRTHLHPVRHAGWTSSVGDVLANPTPADRPQSSGRDAARRLAPLVPAFRV